jgi:hypothetical protein
MSTAVDIDPFVTRCMSTAVVSPRGACPQLSSRYIVGTTNQAPTALAQSVSTAEGTAKAITLTGSDPEGSNLTYTIASNPAHGMLSGSGATRTYTPDISYVGADSFTFTVNDGALTSTPATVSITVAGVPGDLNGDGGVTFEDLSLFLSSCGKSVGQTGFLTGANLNTTGSSASTVDFDDLVAFLALYNP